MELRDWPFIGHLAGIEPGLFKVIVATLSYLFKPDLVLSRLCHPLCVLSGPFMGWGL